MPNKSNIFTRGIFHFRGYYTFFSAYFKSYGLWQKCDLQGLEYVYTPIHRFVWRQSEFAFFGAVTSVAALFDSKGGYNQHRHAPNNTDLVLDNY